MFIVEGQGVIKNVCFKINNKCFRFYINIGRIWDWNCIIYNIIG